MRDQNDAEGLKPYAAPTLAIFGDVARLTASGTGAQSENPGNADLLKKP